MTTKMETAYPQKYETSVILKDGSTSLLRPIREDDVDNWLAFYNRLSNRTKYLRLHGPTKLAREDALRYCIVNYTDTFAFVAETIEDQQKRIVAIGRYARLPSGTTAEVGFIIEDSYQEKGFGTKLIEWLATVARTNGIDTFEAYVLQENRSMLSVFQNYGFSMKRKTQGEVYQVTFPLTKTPEVLMKKEERARVATLNSLRHILNPRSVAVIGASNRPGSIGQLVFESVIRNNFSGVVYPVSATSNAVMSVKAYSSLLDVPGDVDLAIIAVPSSQAIKVIDECGRKKVKGVIVISDGFSESGPEGAALERGMRDIAFGYGMRIIGPNCMGLINTDPQVRLNASFALIFPLHGNIAFMSQSGALGLGILKYAKEAEIGFSSYVSVGNRTDIASTDMLQYWENDPQTKVILLYLESFDNPDSFTRISRRVVKTKPILAIKGGSTVAGSRAAMSHTGAMATPDIVSDALLRQAGIIRANTIERLFDSAILLGSQPVPKGNRVAIITNGGGPGTLAADACARNGLLVPEITVGTLNKLKEVISRDIGIGNPLDLTAAVSAQEFEHTLRILAEDPENDAIIAMYVPPAGISIQDIENAIDKVSPVIAQNRKPILACFVGQTDSKGKVMSSNMFVPYYLFPEDAALALVNAVKYGEMARRKPGVAPQFTDIEHSVGREIIGRALTRSSNRPLWLQQNEINSLLGSYGIRLADNTVAGSAREAASVAAQLGFPVAIKLNSSTITHKSDVGGVILNIKSEREAEDAYNEIKTRLSKIGRKKEMQGVTVQSMVEDGAEVIVGVVADPSLGHVVMFGLGGIYAELIQDTTTRLLPLTDVDVRELVNSVKMIQLLKGYRGSPALDIGSVEDLLLRVSDLLENAPQIVEMDLNPVKVLVDGKGYRVVDARIAVR
jgi:acetate---CoA ligase (ADP-forming)